MRIRTILVTLAGLLLVLVSACSREAGPTPQGAGDDPGPEALQTKINALTVDVCYRTPAEIDPPSCEKYVTQLSNVPGVARELGPPGNVELREASDALEGEIQAYRNNDCAADGTAPDCPQALTRIAEALGAVQAQVLELPQVSQSPS